MLKQTLQDRKGEMTINGALTFLLIMILLILGISVFSVANKASKLHTMAAELTRYIEVRGCIDAGAAAEFARLETVLGIDATLTTEATYTAAGNKIQFGDSFTVTITYETGIGVGGIMQVPITLHSSVVGRSEQYWK